jgi:hypothetical protein
MGNSSSATKLAIAKLVGPDLPDFVPESSADLVAKLVRECILQASDVKALKVTPSVHELFNEHLKRYKKPKYTVSQYLLLLLHTVTTISSLVKQHNSGAISDEDFIKCIKGNATKQDRRAKISRQVGGKKSEANASDRAILPSEIQQGTDTEVS